MSDFYIALFNHCILKCCIYSLMAEQLLYLLYRHSLVDCHRCERSAKLVRMDSAQMQFPAEFMQADLDSSDLKSAVRFLKRYEQRRVIVRSAAKVTLKMDFCPGIEVHLSLLVSFTKDDTLAIGEVNIITVKTDQFSYTHPG